LIIAPELLTIIPISNIRHIPTDMKSNASRLYCSCCHLILKTRKIKQMVYKMDSAEAIEQRKDVQLNGSGLINGFTIASGASFRRFLQLLSMAVIWKEVLPMLFRKVC